VADDFTRHRLVWLDRIAADRDVSPLGFKLAYVIGGFISRKTGDAWPSQETIANRLGVTVRAVRNLVDQLAGAGHLEAVDARGRGKTIHYRMAAKNRNAGSSFPASQKGNGGSGFMDLAPEPKSGTAMYEKRNGHVNKSGTAVPPEPFEEPFEEPSDKNYVETDFFDEGKRGSKTRPQKTSKKAKPKASETGFDAWYEIYPRHVAKEAAAKAYQRIIGSRKATAAELMAGALRYAAEREGHDAQFTKHPSTWLNGACWKDEQQPQQSGLRPRSGGGISSALEGVNSFPGDDDQ
jgi:helix-turn-helix protein